MFKNFIDNQIIRWPAIYLKSDYLKSEMAVLDHIFFVIGNGYKFLEGYPLCPTDMDHIVKYKRVDIASFFKEKDGLFFLETFDDEVASFIKRHDFRIPCVEEYSNDNCVYTTDEDFVETFNTMVLDEWRTLHTQTPCTMRKFKLIKETLFMNIESFYSISKYSLINQINKEKLIKKETVEYALKLLKYVEKFYMKNRYTVNDSGYHVEGEKELLKIEKLKKELERKRELLRMLGDN